MSGPAPAGGLPIRIDLPPEVMEIARRLEERGFSTWCVGGALRDRLLGVAGTDFDLATAATPEQVQKLFPHTVPVGVAFGTVGVLDRNRVLHEVTTFRKDVRTDGRHAEVEFGASLEDDLARRDFTINAMAYHPIREVWSDPFGGHDDLLRHRTVRAVGNAATRFEEDYLRILRMVRFAARLGFAIDGPTWQAALMAAPGLAGLSAERVRDEWFKSLRTARDLAMLQRLWRDVGAAGIWMPELASAYPFADQAPATRDEVVLTAGFCQHSAEVLRRLRASNEEIARARGLGGGPPAPGDGSPLAVRRWLAAVGGAADDLMQLAAYRNGAVPPWGAEVAAIAARGEATSRGQLAITGDDLIAAGFPAGPGLGALLTRLLDLVIEDPSRNQRDALLEAARTWS